MQGEQFLFLPGPTPIPERVKKAMDRPMINHRGSEFKQILEESIDRIKEIYRTKEHILIYPSSGTGGLEAAVVNFISPGDKVLAISIGAFGDRFADIATTFGANVEKINFPWGTAADPQIIKEKIEKDKNRDIKAVLITHNETSTGVFNDVKKVKEAMGDHPALIMIDSISGLATIDLKMDDWQLDVAVSGSQKAFMMPPGLSFMAFNEKALKVYMSNKNNHFYWDINKGLNYLEKGQTPFTPPISLYYGLHEALDMMLEEGIDNIIKRHKNYRDMVRESIKEMGLELFASDAVASSAVTSVIAPEEIGANKIRKYMSDEFNIVLAGGQGKLDDVIFRIGHLGNIRELDILSVLAALEITLIKFAYPLNMGEGLKKAQECILRTRAE